MGQEIEVKINGVDEEKRRLSLNMVDNAKDEEKEAFKSYGQTDNNSSGSFGTLGDLLKAKLGEKK